MDSKETKKILDSLESMRKQVEKAMADLGKSLKKIEGPKQASPIAVERAGLSVVPDRHFLEVPVNLNWTEAGIPAKARFSNLPGGDIEISILVSGETALLAGDIIDVLEIEALSLDVVEP